MIDARGLQKLFERATAFEQKDREKAARNLAHAEIFIVENSNHGRVHALNWLLHVHAGGSFADSSSEKTSQQLRDHIGLLGYHELSPGDARFDDAWEALLSACARLETGLSNRTKGPLYHNRRIFVRHEGLHDTDAMALPDATDPATHREGEWRQITTNIHERNKANRVACMRHYMTLEGRVPCQACAFEFSDVYGAFGLGFIHVHHIHPLGNRQGARDVDPIRDLVPLCPNCHAMIHKGGSDKTTPLSLSELQQIISGASGNG